MFYVVEQNRDEWYTPAAVRLDRFYDGHGDELLRRHPRNQRVNANVRRAPDTLDLEGISSG